MVKTTEGRVCVATVDENKHWNSDVLLQLLDLWSLKYPKCFSVRSVPARVHSTASFGTPSFMQSSPTIFGSTKAIHIEFIVECVFFYYYSRWIDESAVNRRSEIAFEISSHRRHLLLLQR